MLPWAGIIGSDADLVNEMSTEEDSVLPFRWGVIFLPNALFVRRERPAQGPENLVHGDDVQEVVMKDRH